MECLTQRGPKTKRRTPPWLWVFVSGGYLEAEAGGDGALWFRRELGMQGWRRSLARHSIPDNAFNRSLLERAALRCLHLHLRVKCEA